MSDEMLPGFSAWQSSEAGFSNLQARENGDVHLHVLGMPKMLSFAQKPVFYTVAVGTIGSVARLKLTLIP